MAQIKKLQIDNETLYPVTIPQAVVDPDSNKTTREELDEKVDKVTGKQLSTEDYTTAEKSKVTNLPLNTTSELALKFDKANLESARSQSTTKVPTSKLLDDEFKQLQELGVFNEIKKSERTDVNYVFEGDSRTAVGTFSQKDYPAYLAEMSNFAGTGNFYNVASGGQSIYGMIDNYEAEVFPLRPIGEINKSYLFVLIGINDLMDASPDFNLLSTLVLTYCDLAKLHGFTVILMTTFYRNDMTSVQELARLRFNDNLRYGALGKHILIDLEQLFPPAVSNPFYYDVVHLKEAGNMVIAEYINFMFSLTGMGSSFFDRVSSQNVFSSATNILFWAQKIGFGISSPDSQLVVNTKASGNVGGNIKIHNTANGAVNNASELRFGVSSAFNNVHSGILRAIAKSDGLSTDMVMLTYDATLGLREIIRSKHTGTVSLPLLKTYADNASAVSAGLSSGDMYKTTTGDLKIVV